MSLFGKSPFRQIHYALRLVVDTVAGLPGRSHHSGERKVLIIRPDGIGDFIVWLGALRALRAHHADQRIVLVANQLFSQLAARLGCFDEVIPLDPKRFEWDLGYRWRMARRIRKIGADVALYPVYSRHFWVGDCLVRASCANERIGFDGDLSNRSERQKSIGDRWFTQLVPAAPGKRPEFIRHQEFLKGLGMGDGLAPGEIHHRLAELPPGLQQQTEYFIVFPGAGANKRQWPTGHFAEVGREISTSSGWRMLVCGSEREAVLADEVLEQAGLPDAVSLAGRTTVEELVELIRGAKLVVANETSAVHIAAAVATPSVCLLGGGHFERFVPYPEAASGKPPVPVFESMPCYGCNWRCTQPHEPGGPAPCIDAIPVRAVLDAAKPFLQEKEPHVQQAH